MPTAENTRLDKQQVEALQNEILRASLYVLQFIPLLAFIILHYIFNVWSNDVQRYHLNLLYVALYIGISSITHLIMSKISFIAALWFMNITLILFSIIFPIMFQTGIYSGASMLLLIVITINALTGELKAAVFISVVAVITYAGLTYLNLQYFPSGGKQLAPETLAAYLTCTAIMFSLITIIAARIHIKTLSLLRKKAQELKTSKIAAESANLAKSQFLTMMSHEIRTPMNGIIGMAQIVKDPDINEMQRQTYLSTLLRSSRQMMDILNDLLDLSTIDQGEITLKPETFSMALLLTDIETWFREIADEKNLQFIVNGDSVKNCSFNGDSRRLRQILNNLVSNALKFTREGNVNLTIDWQERPARIETGIPVRLRFTISDTGIGITNDKLSAVFEPFFQVDRRSTRAYGGTGLGLAIAQRIVKLMGGEIQVTSAPNRGTSFWIDLPFTIAENYQEDGDAISRTQDYENLTSNPMTVMIVEDNPVNVQVLQAMLQRENCVIINAENGLQAVDAITAQRVRPDLIFMDCQMPVMDGIEATRRIRHWEQKSSSNGIPIIALTAAAFPEDRERCMQVGMNEFMTKPISRTQLQQALQRWQKRKTKSL